MCYFYGTKRFPGSRGYEEGTCAVHCVAAVFAHHGRKVSFKKLHHQMKPTPMAGTGTDGLLDVLQRNGFIVGLYASLTLEQVKNVLDVDGQIIAHVDGNHGVVLHGLSDTHAYIADSGRWLTRQRLETFLGRWTLREGIVVLAR